MVMNNLLKSGIHHLQTYNTEKREKRKEKRKKSLEQWYPSESSGLMSKTPVIVKREVRK